MVFHNDFTQQELIVHEFSESYENLTCGKKDSMTVCAFKNVLKTLPDFRLRVNCNETEQIYYEEHRGGFKNSEKISDVMYMDGPKSYANEF